MVNNGLGDDNELSSIKMSSRLFLTYCYFNWLCKFALRTINPLIQCSILMIGNFSRRVKNQQGTKRYNSCEEQQHYRAIFSRKKLNLLAT